MAIDLPGVRALFTTRRGGVSEGPYATLNLGLWTDDDPGAVSANRDRLAGLVGIERGSFVQGRQVHGAEIRLLDAPPAEEGGLERPPSGGRTLPKCDGQIATVRGIAPIVLVADCLPIALAAPGAAGMLHAGWRGLAAGLVERAVAALPPGARAAAIGPGAGPCCYEVGEEVHAAFASHEGARRGDNLDLKDVAAARLRAAGVEEIHDAGLCTICSDPALFFSHRRDGGVTGRQAGVAWLT